MKMHETQPEEDNKTTSLNEVEPFNDVANHMHNIMGVRTKKAYLKDMPAPVRWFFYFIVTVIIVGFALAFIGERLN